MRRRRAAPIAPSPRSAPPKPPPNDANSGDRVALRNAATTFVWKVTVTVDACEPSRVTDEPGEKPQVELAGSPPQLMVTVWVEPPSGVTVSASVSEVPAATVTDVGFTLPLKSGAGAVT